MQIFVPKEVESAEPRIAMVPDAAAKLAEAGADVAVETGLGDYLIHFRANTGDFLQADLVNLFRGEIGARGIDPDLVGIELFTVGQV